MFSSEVLSFSFTIIPPLGPTSNPHSFANSSLGLIPAEMTSMSTPIDAPSENCIPLINSSPRIAVVFLFV